jgi:hypothetical protein
MRKRIRPLLRKLDALEARRGRILQLLTDDAPLLVGSVSLVKRTCGKPTCHCAERPAHAAWVLATTEGGRRRCQVVRQADVEDICQRVTAYKDFRRALREFDATHREEIALLRGLQGNRDVRYE